MDAHEDTDLATVTHTQKSGNYLQRRVFHSTNGTVRGSSLLSFKMSKKDTPGDTVSYYQG